MTSTPVFTADDLVDPHVGLVRALHPVPRHDGMPAAYVGISAEVADSRALGAWPSDRVSLGTTFDDVEGARRAAIGEAVERYCGNYVPTGLRRATPAALRAEGRRLLGPDDLRFFQPWQYAAADFPFRPFTDDLEIAWRTGMTTSGPVEVPASWTHLNWRSGTGRRRHDRPLHHLNYAGIATGLGLEDAVTRGLLELIERDALCLWWHLDLPARRLDPSEVPGLTAIFDGSRLEVHLVALPTYFEVPVVAALVRDPLLGIAAGGFAAKSDPAETARKAVLEALHTWVFSQGLLDADGYVRRAMDAGVLVPELYLPHRGDRGYLDDVGTRCARIRDLGAHAQVWLDPRVQERLLHRFTAPGPDLALSAMPHAPSDLRARLDAGGHEVVHVDLTTSDIAMTPLRVVRVCARGLVPNAPAAFPYLGLPRYDEVARDAGVAARPAEPDSLVLLPPPSL